MTPNLPPPAPPPAPLVLTAAEVFQVFRKYFPTSVAESLVAVARRESNFEPAAYNGNSATGDNSYGLLQINVRDKGIAAIVTSMGYTPEQLKDPDINAQVAHRLWAGKLANLDVLWRILTPGVYRDKYLAHLPEAHQAALEALA